MAFRSEADIRREVEAVGTVDAGRAERHLSSSGARGEAELDFAAFSKLMAKLASQGDTDALWAALEALQKAINDKAAGADFDAKLRALGPLVRAHMAPAPA